jgi:HK97 family phage prohead protease
VPYFISEDTECPEWAVIKDDGMIIACHDTKESAIDQMVAISIEENIEPGGERYIHKKKKRPMRRELPENYRPATSDDVPEGRACGNCFFFNEDDVAPDGRARCEKWDEYVEGGFVCNSWKEDSEQRAPVAGMDKFTTEAEALAKAKELGCEGTHSMDEDGQTIYMPCSTHAAYDKLAGTTTPGYRKHTDSHDDPSSTPAPKEEQIEGSDENKPGSAKGPGGDIKLGEATETGLRNKVKAHNEEMEEAGKPPYTRTTFGQLAAVFRRGAGAYSASHRPGMTRNQWAMARVNAYLYLLANGKPRNEAYITDNDLLPEAHPKSTRSMSEDRAIDQDAPAYMRASARRGLEFHAEGLSGDGVTDQTIREARLMVDGKVSDDKWVRLSAWIARHLVDLDSPDSDPDSEDYPSPGVVAHLLWGSGPTKRAAQRTKDYADSVVARIRAEETMETNNKWLDVARAIALKIDGPISKEPEVRVNSTEIEVREDTADGMTFSGYASVFNSASEDLGGFIEYVAPGAFKRSLQSRNEIKLLWNHDTGEPLASLRGGTMQLVEDKRGLKVTANLPNTTRGRDVAELLRTKVIDSMSFGFNVIRDAWSGDGKTRTLESVRLSEVSIVTFPAYNSTIATIRSAPTINPDELADALLRLESGEDLTEEQATLITDVVGKLKAQSDIEEVIDNGLDLLDLKKKQFDLLMKRI